MPEGQLDQVTTPYDDSGMISVWSALLGLAEDIGPPTAWEANSYTRDVWLRFATTEHFGRWVQATRAQPHVAEGDDEGVLRVSRAVAQRDAWSVHLCCYTPR